MLFKLVRFFERRTRRAPKRRRPATPGTQERHAAPLQDGHPRQASTPRPGQKWTRDPRDDRQIAALRTIKGKAHVIDGDTIVIRRVKVRLAGIDAPELDQPWGQKSKWAMVDICKGQVLTAHLTGQTSHDRMVGTCYLPDGRDIGAELIKRGLALDFTTYSGGRYRHLECAEMRRKLRNARPYR